MQTCKILINRRKSCRNIESLDVYLTQILKKKDFDFVSGLIYLFTNSSNLLECYQRGSPSLGNVERRTSNSGPLYPRFNALSTQLLFFYNLKSFLKSFPNNLSFPVRTQCCFDVHTTSF